MVEMGRRQVDGIHHPSAFRDHLGTLGNPTELTAPASAFLTCPRHLVPIVRIEPSMLHDLTAFSPHVMNPHPPSTLHSTSPEHPLNHSAPPPAGFPPHRYTAHTQAPHQSLPERLPTHTCAWHKAHNTYPHHPQSPPRHATTHNG